MLNRRAMLSSLAAGVVAHPSLESLGSPLFQRPVATTRPLRRADGTVDWDAVRALYSLNPEWTHLSTFLFSSHPKPVADAIDFFRRKFDSDHVWIEQAALKNSEGRLFVAVKKAIADYIGGKAGDVCLTANTTTALAMAYHGLHIRPDQEILTTNHDHMVHHESIRHSVERSGASVRYIALR